MPIPIIRIIFHCIQVGIIPALYAFGFLNIMGIPDGQDDIIRTNEGGIRSPVPVIEPLTEPMQVGDTHVNKRPGCSN